MEIGCVGWCSKDIYELGRIMWIDSLDQLPCLRGNYSVFDFAEFDVYELNQRMAYIHHPTTKETALVNVYYTNGFPYFQIEKVLRDRYGNILDGEYEVIK